MDNWWFYIYRVVLVLINNIISISNHIFASVSIDIEISGHGCFPRKSFRTLSRVLEVSRNVNKYGASGLAVSEI